MQHILKSNEFKPYKVVIIWEHGGQNPLDEKEISFKTEDEMDEFLNFIYELRNFIPNIGYENLGHFSDSHYEMLDKWIKEVDFKYGSKFSSFIPVDKYYGTGHDGNSLNYRAKIAAIHVEINGDIHNIVWGKAIKQNSINLPNLYDKVAISTGHINGHTLGVEIFGGKSSDYYDYMDFEHKDLDLPEGEYSSINLTLTDISIQMWKPYVYIASGTDNGLVKYHDYTSFDYVLLLRFGKNTGHYVVSTKRGYDPEYGSKFHKPNFGNMDYYLVE
jgi:hypothetical protein